jgi:hypothetical protein
LPTGRRHGKAEDALAAISRQPLVPARAADAWRGGARRAAVRYNDDILGDARRRELWWLFGGRADGAKSVLESISGSIITVTGVVFSVTIIALQLASSQFTPRVLRQFMADRGNQLVLGVFIGTFTYTLLVQRTSAARSTGEEFVPAGRRHGRGAARARQHRLPHLLHQPRRPLDPGAVIIDSDRQGYAARALKNVFPTASSRARMPGIVTTGMPGVVEPGRPRRPCGCARAGYSRRGPGALREDRSRGDRLQHAASRWRSAVTCCPVSGS